MFGECSTLMGAFDCLLTQHNTTFPLRFLSESRYFIDCLFVVIFSFPLNDYDVNNKKNISKNDRKQGTIVDNQIRWILNEKDISLNRKTKKKI